MRWTRGERSEDLEDRRGESSGRGSGLRVGGGVGLGGAAILLVLSLVFAQAYVLAHEIGHHVQRLLGLTDQVRGQQSRPDRANALSVRLELQADCLAGVWAHSTNERRLLEEGDVEEALGAASAVGDDRIQKQAGARVTPETWTHGSARQRAGWFRRGLESGRMQDCDTFRTALPGVEERAQLRSR